MKYYETYEDFKKDFPEATFKQYLDHKLSGYIGR